MKRIISAFLAAAMMLPAAALPAGAADVQYQAVERRMEKLDRGTVAVYTGGGVFLSWRLLGTESLENQAFDVYRDGEKIYTSAADGATCWTDASGKADSKYKVVPEGADAAEEKEITPWTGYASRNEGGNDNRGGYLDIKFEAPKGGTTPDGAAYKYTANDMSVGDLDGDGQYELVVKWDPSNSKDNSYDGYTGNVIMDAYELDGTRLWRMDLGVNIRAGAHYTQYMVYDFDGDGKSEIAFRTAPGSKDGQGNYVSAVPGAKFTSAPDTDDYREENGRILKGAEWLTIFNGETGAAMQTVDYDPNRLVRKIAEGVNAGYWGDGNGNRCDRFLAGVAYLDGRTPSLIMCRGYYTFAYVAAYKWDGKNLTEQWLHSSERNSSNVTYANGTTKTSPNKYTLYGQGAHSLSIADVDNDGLDEIIFGSAVLDDDGTVLYSDKRGHGDAEHVSDFDNDGKQEIFMVHEAGKGNDKTIEYAVDLKRYNNETKIMDDVMKQAAQGDIGRGVIGNFDDKFSSEGTNSRSVFMTVADGSSVYGMSGEKVSAWGDPNRPFQNFMIYWDGDLGRELLDKNWLAKYSAASGGTSRFYWGGGSSGSYIPDISYNNDTKANPGLVADILGDWREEMVFPLSDGTGARIFTSCIPTQYRLTTLMHDSQYRCAIAWQNVGYNQPPHTSYYIGSASLATDESGAKKNYLAPAVPFTNVSYEVKEIPKTNHISIVSAADKNADISYMVMESHESVKLIGALYDGERLAEVKEKIIEAPQTETELTDTITFDNNTAGYDLKVFLWKTDVSAAEPICEAAVKQKAE